VHGEGNRNNRFRISAAQFLGGRAMQHPGFFERAGPFALRVIAERVGAALTRKEDGYRMIEDVQTLRGAGPGNLAFFDNRKYAGQLADTLACACILDGANDDWGGNDNCSRCVIGFRVALGRDRHDGVGALDGTLYIVAIGVDKYPGLPNTCLSADGSWTASCNLGYAGSDARFFCGDLGRHCR
jgi:hypothetical protein